MERQGGLSCRDGYPARHHRPNVPTAKAVDVKLLKKDIEKLKYAGLDLSDLMR